MLPYFPAFLLVHIDTIDNGSSLCYHSGASLYVLHYQGFIMAFTVRLAPELEETVKAIAAVTGQTLNGVVASALLEYVHARHITLSCLLSVPSSVVFPPAAASSLVPVPVAPAISPATAPTPAATPAPPSRSRGRDVPPAPAAPARQRKKRRR
jgi:hypothetical protein